MRHWIYKATHYLKKYAATARRFLRSEVKNPLPRKYQAAVLVVLLLVPGVAALSALNNLNEEMRTLHNNVSKNANEELVKLLNDRSKDLSAMTSQKGHEISIQETELDQLTQHISALEKENSRLSTELHEVTGTQEAPDDKKDEDKSNWWDRWSDGD